MARIVRASNKDLEWFNEKYLAVPAMEICDCEAVCYILNKACGPDSDIFYKAVEHGYVLYEGMVA